MTSVLFADTHAFSRLVVDYVSQNEKLRPFYQYDCTPEAVAEVMQDKQKEPINRILLADTIMQQYAHIDILQSVREQIQALQQENTCCVVTAHQLNIFTGPLYYIYKIAATVATCLQLKERYPDKHFVPVYWMGSEDHDFEEINHLHIFGKEIVWDDKQGGATGNYSTHSMDSVLQEVQQILGTAPHAETLMDIFKAAYQQPTLAMAGRYLVDALFGQYGVVVVDGNDVAFKRQYAAVMREELLKQTSFALVSEQISQLEAAGYKQQAAPRDINLFYLSERSRERIVLEGNQYKVLNTDRVFSQEEILAELETHPERFSPNVILRPLFQQMMLPSVMYIGGGGEVSYWLQLRTLFAHFGTAFPQLMVRNSFMLVKEQQLARMEKLGLTIQDFFRDVEELKKAYIGQNADEDIDVSGYKQEVEAVFTRLQELAKSVDVTLGPVAGAEMQKALQSVEMIQKRMMKALKQKNETALNQIEKLKTQLFPQQSLQERVENFAPYFAQSGQSFIDAIIADTDLYQRQFIIKTIV